jgi:membrane associated rhomboid family serine protease
MIIIIIAITAIFSIVAFNQTELQWRYNFNAYQIIHRNQWYRIITHAFLHADWMHLLVNMMVFYSFGKALLYNFTWIFRGNQIWMFLGVYFGGIIASSVYSLIKQKDNYNYNAIGASGGVAAVTFACIFFDPMEKVLFFGILPIPGIIFALLYLGYSYYMSKKNIDNIGHDAHFYGALYGFIFPILFKPELFNRFIEKLISW